MAHDALEKQVRGGSEAHGRARVPRAGLLNRVHRQGTDDVDRAPVEVGPLKGWHEFAAQLLDLRI
ncbi:hypothetical protein GCM10023259_062440 [Thermocatellispora tengchongensis]